MADVYTVNANGLKEVIYVRKGPSAVYAKVRELDRTKPYTAYERKNDWIKISKSAQEWAPLKSATTGRTILQKSTTIDTVPATKNTSTGVGAASSGLVNVISSSSSSTISNLVGTTTTTNENNNEDDNENYAWIPSSNLKDFTDADYDREYTTDLPISSLRGIFGMPYQFTPEVDARIAKDINETTGQVESYGEIGRKYGKEIVENMPLLLITPGKPRFMGKYTDDQKKTILETLITGSDSDDDLNTSILGDKFGKYYSLEYAYDEYYQYVNPMCRVAARILGVHNEKIDGWTLDNYEWSKHINENFSKLFSIYNGSTGWYCDSVDNISESFSNDADDSAIVSKINGLSSTGREIQFLLGTAKTSTGTAVDKFTDIDNYKESLNEFTDALLSVGNGIGGIVGVLTNSLETISQGGKIVFPKIWSGSSFSRSYSVSLKLISPDGDDLSIYLNIIVPMLHLLGLALPRESKSGHGYISPFLVRAYYKGLFNVDMGIISNLSFSKGKEAAWNDAGLPLTVDVSFDILDLYEDMYITSNEGDFNILNNIILLDYISTLCGININEPDIVRAIDLWYTQKIENKVVDFVRYKRLYLKNLITNKVSSIFGNF